EMRAIFERLGFDVETAPRVALRNQKRATLGATGWTVVVPTARRDIAIEEDLIEEVGRIYGYDSIPETRPQSDLVSAAAPLEVRNRDRTLAAFYAAGFTEARTYSFIGDRETALLDDGARKTLIELENPQSRSATALRPLVLPSLALAAAEALKFTPSLRYCELARVFRHSKTARDTSGLEENRLAFIVAEKTKEAGRGFVFYELKGALDSIFESLGLPEVWYDDVPSTPALITQDVGRFLHPYQAALIKIGNRTVGIMGVVHPDMRNVLDIPVEAAAGELYFDAFEKELESEKEYRAVSKYPAVLRDIAVLVPKDIRMTEVEDRIQNAGGELLADVDLFDAFEGDEIGADKKNLAFHLIFQSEERTLTVAEVEALMKKITSALEADEGWEVR
ncbi:MAG: hypothetical protein HYS44_00920, partial [Candidatus Niyogibacteria bacterium]|nr:hypothetical protein [Candidatus Niyogibacteria bacterium]